MRIEDKLSQMGLTLPELGPPAGNYVGAVRVGNLLFVSGHGPRSQGVYITGKVGRDLDVEQAYEAAKVVMLNCLASVKRELGDLDRVKRVVKLLGMVNCTEDFTQHPNVINGGSDLLVALYGEHGRHARSAVGMQQLPMNIPVEIEMILEVQE
ncbi:MAG: RidA family protein [Candidatus Tectomicrobia bacterium]|uniref:RidA family protein n=1 Tax=Tectimicrobiota bacterium TaxID=2528274 RepID=A0A937VZQ1_UNCTE|nr:RidA family protein [Candidatus Tectomicrobia bacterium]